MARKFITRVDDDHDSELAQSIADRENELASYYRNIESYTAQLEAMSDVEQEWPAELVRFRGKSNDQIMVLDVSPEDAEKASELNHRDRLKRLLFTEGAEAAKSEIAYDALLKMLPEGPRRDAAFAKLSLSKGSQ